MKLIEIDHHHLKIAMRPCPTPAAHQVLIKVIAAGVNRPDLMQRKGLYPPPTGASDILGLEVAGVIVAIGDEVVQWQVGKAVCALVTGGGYAEYCLASAALCLPIPRGFSFVQAAAIPETFFTVWSNVFDRAQLKASETLLVHGGGSGIGTTAIQLANAFGASVMVTAGSDEKCQRCLALGAKLAINYHTQDFVDGILNNTHHQGVNVILDSIGGDYLMRNIQCLAFDGRLVQIALQQGVKTTINLLPFLLKRLMLTGSTLRARDDHFKAVVAQSLYTEVWPLFAEGRIQPIIDSVFELHEAAQAHALMERSQHFGKIVLVVDPTLT
jgi:putative PIG3 family NAD(P)H quinone oxidoreductase